MSLLGCVDLSVALLGLVDAKGFDFKRFEQTTPLVGVVMIDVLETTGGAPGFDSLAADFDHFCCSTFPDVMVRTQGYAFTKSAACAR